MQTNSLAAPSTGILYSLVSRVFFPGAVLISFSLFLVVHSLWGNIEAAAFIPGIVFAFVAYFLEKRFPYRSAWNTPYRKDTRIDIPSTITAMAFTEPVIKTLLTFTVVTALGMAGIASIAIFPVHLPFVLQIILVTLMGELGGYWAHRWHHTSARLWWLHALHHGSKRLYLLNQFRVHPLNHMIIYVIKFLPLMVIGVPQEVLYGYIALTQTTMLLQHANLPFKSGILNYVFSTNELHRWHHSSLKTEANNNYGNALIFWDIVFGTFLYKKEGGAPESIGLFSGSAKVYPETASFLRQVFSK